MMQMCAHFQEPYWLRQLFLGNAPETITHEDIDEPGMMDVTLAHLVELGVPRLTPEQTPDALPTGLAPRAEHEMDQARIIGCCARWTCGGHLGALMAYAQYLRPRWGGSYETSTAWPADRCARRCPSRSATRSAGSASSIRWAIIRSRTTPRRWRNTARCSNRSCSASCGRKSAAWRWVLRAVRQLFAGGSGQARALHAQSAAAFPPNRYFGDVDGPFRSFAHVSIIHGLPDDDGAFKSVLERMCHWDTVAAPQALAAVAHHYGRWGFARDPARAQQLLDRAAVLAQDQADDDFNVLAAAAMLWDGGDHEQGYF